MALMANHGVGAGEKTSRIELVGKTIQISDTPSYCAFTDLARLANGELIIVYYAGTSHIDPNSTLQMRISKDNGKTWSDARTAVPSINSGNGVRDPHIIQLADGALLLSYFSRKGNCEETKVVRSVDNGKTWSERVVVESPMEWTATSGKIFALDAGTLLIPVYGSMKGETGERAGLVRSTDMGKTWSGFVTVATQEAAGTGECNEMELARLPDGSLVAMVRSGIRSISKDNGQTWSKAEIIVEFQAAGLLVNGPGLLMNHRGAGATQVALSTDGGKTFPDAVPLTPAQGGDCGYGTIVTVPGGDPAPYFTAYYSREGNSVKVFGQFFKIK